MRMSRLPLAVALGRAFSLRAGPSRAPSVRGLAASRMPEAEPGMVWSTAHNKSATQLLWALGRTPFAPYSARAELSFALRDAALRAPLHAVAAEVLQEVRALRDYFAEFGKSADDVLTPSEHLPFLRRLNVLAYKLQRARSLLSLHNFDAARHHLLSTEHDLRAMRAILERTSRTLSTKLVCS